MRKMRKTVKRQGGTIKGRGGTVLTRTGSAKASIIRGVTDETDSVECYVSPAFEDEYRNLAHKNLNVFRHKLSGYVTIQNELIDFYAKPENRLCVGISKDYVIGSIESCEMLILAVRNDDSGRQILGFATLFFHLIQEVIPGALKIDVICGSAHVKGAGTLMLKTCKDIASSMGATEIKLSSVKTNNTISFYRKRGFTFDDPEDTDCKPETDFDDQRRYRRSQLKGETRTGTLTSLCEMTLQHSPH